MLSDFNKFYKRFFSYFGKTELKIIKSTGLVFLKDFMLRSRLIYHLECSVIDLRNQILIKYSSTEILSGIILRILDGEERLYHQRNKVNNHFYEICNTSGQVPHFTTLRYYLKKNPHTYKNLRNVLENTVLEEIAKKGIKKITVEIDQTGKIVYGRSNGVMKGYVSGRKNKKCYQLVVWSIRELGLLYKVELLPGNIHCAKGFLKKLKLVVEKLTSLGIELRIICDSGYEKEAIFKYLQSKNVEFVFARKQRTKVKLRGKNAKNKTEISDNYIAELIIKERYWNEFREIYIQNRLIRDELGQYWLKEFDSNEFTNVLITNMIEPVEEIYTIYKQRAIIENVIKELKNEFGFGIAHNKTMAFNRSVAFIVAIAYNLKNMFVEYLTSTKSMCFKGLPTVRTLRNQIFHIPGILVNNGGRKIVKLNQYFLEKLGNIIKIFGYQIT